jgi:leader peptidase (prepilin peptidase) / N-methyltransferase
MALIYFFIFITGAAFGSFFNVCIWRLPRKLSLITPRSQCPQCHAYIKSYHNIPIISYILLQGKCKYCGEKMELNYFLVELITPLIWLLLFWRFGNEFNIVFAKYLVFFSFSIIIFFIDLHHQIIPDKLSLPLLIIGLAFALAKSSDINIFPALAGAGAGFLFFYLLALAVSHSLNREAMGGGDIKFIATIGAFLGVYGVLFTIFIAAAIALSIVIISGKDRSREIPFGPFLITGAFIHTLFGDWLLGSYLNLFY